MRLLAFVSGSVAVLRSGIVAASCSGVSAAVPFAHVGKRYSVRMTFTPSRFGARDLRVEGGEARRVELAVGRLERRPVGPEARPAGARVAEEQAVARGAVVVRAARVARARRAEDDHAAEIRSLVRAFLDRVERTVELAP